MNGAAIIEWLPLAHTGNVAILPGKNRGATRRAERIGAMTVRESDTVLREPVNLGRLVDPAAVGTDGMRRVVIAHNEKNIWRHVQSVLMRLIM